MDDWDWLQLLQSKWKHYVFIAGFVVNSFSFQISAATIPVLSLPATIANIRACTIRYDTMRFVTILYGNDTIRFDTNTLTYGTVRNDTIRYDTCAFGSQS